MTDFLTRSENRFPTRQENAALQGHAPYSDPKSYEAEPFDWTRHRPGLFRSYAAPLVLITGALLVIGALLFL